MPPHERGAAGVPATAGNDHWKRLLHSSKVPVALSTEQYVDAMNVRLRADPCYRAGTRFVVALPQPEEGRPGGPSWEGPESMKPVIVRLVNSVGDEFNVAEPFLSER